MASPDLALEIFREDLNNRIFPHPEIADLTNVGIKAAIESARILRDFFYGSASEDLGIEWKEDATPRTKADVLGDVVIVRTIRTERKQDDINIEESGYHKGLVTLEGDKNAGVIWDADSLDGTRPFVEGKPESAVGVGARDRRGRNLLGVIVHPFRRQLAVAVRGLGAYLIPLSEELEVDGDPVKMQVSKKTSFAGATIAIDSLYTPANWERKPMLLKAIQRMAFSDRGIVSHDELGSNIAYELEVARGAALLGITDAIPADKGTWDWNPGKTIIMEAGGIMIDPTTNRQPRSNAEVVIYGNRQIVKRIQPYAGLTYAGYKGFDTYDFEEWKREFLRLQEDPIGMWSV